MPSMIPTAACCAASSADWRAASDQRRRLILSDLAEHLGLRSREALLDMISQAGLRVIERIDTRPTHGRAQDPNDPLHAARSKEVTSLWRLGAA